MRYVFRPSRKVVAADADLESGGKSRMDSARSRTTTAGSRYFSQIPSSNSTPDFDPISAFPSPLLQQTSPRLQQAEIIKPDTVSEDSTSFVLRSGKLEDFFDGTLPIWQRRLSRAGATALRPTFNFDTAQLTAYIPSIEPALEVDTTGPPGRELGDLIATLADTTQLNVILNLLSSDPHPNTPNSTETPRPSDENREKLPQSGRKQDDRQDEHDEDARGSRDKSSGGSTKSSTSKPLGPAKIVTFVSECQVYLGEVTENQDSLLSNSRIEVRVSSIFLA